MWASEKGPIEVDGDGHQIYPPLATRLPNETDTASRFDMEKSEVGMDVDDRGAVLLIDVEEGAEVDEKKNPWCRCRRFGKCALCCPRRIVVR